MWHQSIKTDIYTPIKYQIINASIKYQIIKAPIMYIYQSSNRKYQIML